MKIGDLTKTLMLNIIFSSELNLDYRIFVKNNHHHSARKGYMEQTHTCTEIMMILIIITVTKIYNPYPKYV